MVGSPKIALAIDIRCSCPPDRLAPLSSIFVSYPFGSCLIKSCAFAVFAASIIFSLFVDLPNLIASIIVPENINVFCGTIAINLLK